MARGGELLNQLLPQKLQKLRTGHNVKTITVTILPIGTPTTPTAVTVVRQTVAWVKHEPSKGQNPQPDAQDWIWNVVGRPKSVFKQVDDTGHVIAKALGGHADLSLPLNVFPQHPAVNTNPPWISREQEVVKYAKDPCNHVCVRVTLDYPKGSSYPARPNWLQYEVWVNGSEIPPGGGVKVENILNL